MPRAPDNNRDQGMREGPSAEKSPPLMSCRMGRSLPLFATDKELGAALLGPTRVQEWLAMLPLLESKGLVKIDPLMHGRYVPAVRAFFDGLYGLDRGATSASPLAPDGAEDLEAWRNKSRRS